MFSKKFEGKGKGDFEKAAVSFPFATSKRKGK